MAAEGDANARAAIDTDSFPRHFAETRRLRFTGGQGIASRPGASAATW